MYKKLHIKIISVLILALMASYLTYGYLVKVKDKIEIVVAKEEILPYTLIEEKHIQIIYVSAEDQRQLFPNAVQDPNEVLGAITRESIAKDKPIEKTPDYLMYGEEQTLALNANRSVDKTYFIPYDQRVIAIDVDSTGGLNYTLQQGDFVDIIFTSTDDSKGGLYSTLILQHIQIFAIDKKPEQNEGLERRQKILLLVTPEEAMQVAVAKRNGTIDLVLNPMEGETEIIESVHLWEFMKDKPVKKSEMLEGLEYSIKEQDLSEQTKNEIINSIKKEKEIETLKSMIEVSEINQQEKDKLLTILK